MQRVGPWLLMMCHWLHGYANAAFHTVPLLPENHRAGLVPALVVRRGKESLTSARLASSVTASPSVSTNNTIAATSTSEISATAMTAAALVGGATTVMNVNALNNERIQRSLIVAVSCIVTLWLRTQFDVTVIQASSITGIAASLVLPSPAMVAAAFCGSFAGMSGHISSLVPNAAILGGLASIMYYVWDAKKICLGVGGRLGTIAFCANLVYYAFMRNGINAAQRLAVQTVQTLTPSTASVVIVWGLVLHLSRKSSGTVVLQVQPSATGNLIQRKNILIYASKFALMGAMAARLWTANHSAVVGAVDYARTATAIFVASIVAKQSHGLVLPTSVIGLAGSLIAGSSSLAAPIYLGSIMGMTSLQNFTIINFVQSSILAAMVFHLGLFDGFGGKLGFISVLGVLFGM